MTNNVKEKVAVLWLTIGEKRIRSNTKREKEGEGQTKKERKPLVVLSQQF